MKIKVKISDAAIRDIVEQVLVDQYKFDLYSHSFDEKIESAMQNKDFMKDIKKGISIEIEDNVMDGMYQYASDFSMRSPKYYGLKQ
jgi:hypothetical protein